MAMIQCVVIPHHSLSAIFIMLFTAMRREACKYSATYPDVHPIDTAILLISSLPDLLVTQ